MKKGWGVTLPNLHTMTRVLSLILSVILLVSFVSLALEVPAIFRQYTDTRKICNIVVKHAQENGGITSETVQILNDLIVRHGLTGKISDIAFYPEVDVPVQKRDKFYIQYRPVIEVNIPFYGKKDYSGSFVKVVGYSHKYYKPL